MEFYYVALAGLELCMYTRLTSNSQWPNSFYFPRYTQLNFKHCSIQYTGEKMKDDSFSQCSVIMKNNMTTASLIKESI